MGPTKNWWHFARVSILIVILVMHPGAVLCAPKESGSGQEATESVEEDDRLPIHKEGWQFIVAPYVWLPGVDLELRSQGRFNTRTTVGILWHKWVPELFQGNLLFLMGRVEVWKGRWGIFYDNFWIYVGEAGNFSKTRALSLIDGRLVSSANVKGILRLGYHDLGVRFLVRTLPLSSEKPLPVLSCELLGGIRYNWYNVNINVNLNTTIIGPSGERITRGESLNISPTQNIFEPFLGLRLGFWPTKKLTLMCKADMGGFGVVANDHLDANLEALLGYQVQKHIRLDVGYRARYFELNTNRGAKEFDIQGWLHGPVFGIVFIF